MTTNEAKAAVPIGNNGSISAPGFMAPPAMWRCCASMDAVRTGECGQGCCDDYTCRSCGKTWRYEWPD